MKRNTQYSITICGSFLLSICNVVQVWSMSNHNNTWQLVIGAGDRYFHNVSLLFVLYRTNKQSSSSAITTTHEVKNNNNNAWTTWLCMHTIIRSNYRSIMICIYIYIYIVVLCIDVWHWCRCNAKKTKGINERINFLYNLIDKFIILTMYLCFFFLKINSSFYQS